MTGSKPITNPNVIRCKAKRSLVYKRYKEQLRKQRKAARELKKDTPGITRTIDSTREVDHTVVETEDPEITKDQEDDEFSAYFKGEKAPKILITTNNKPVGKTYSVAEELLNLLPGAEFYKRQSQDLQHISKISYERGFTDIVVCNESRGKICDTLTIVHLPNGPTAKFRLSNVVLAKDLPHCARSTPHAPELVFNGFKTIIGVRVGRFLASLFPQIPDFTGRRVVTFHNQRDYIFCRQHRYIFRNKERVGLQEIGPRFTLKLKSIQKGAFETEQGEYEWQRVRFAFISKSLA